MIDEQLLDSYLKPFEKGAKYGNIEKFIRSTIKKDVDYMHFPKYVLMNGYNYAKIKEEKIKDLDEYMDFPFIGMLRDRFMCLKTRKGKSKLEVFMNEPKPKEVDAGDCFVAGMNLYFTEKMQQAIKCPS